MARPIVVVRETQQVAPAPLTLQQTSAFISQGGTTTAQGTLSLITQSADWTAIMAGALSISTATWAGGLLTVTAGAPLAVTTIGDTFSVVLSGFTNSAAPSNPVNGTYLATVTGASTFTVPIAVTPGTISVIGKYTLEDVGELNQQITTFFAQGNIIATYILEAGAGSPADGVTYLTGWLIANPLSVYIFGLPRTWAGEATFPTLVATYEGLASRVYFAVTMTGSNYTNFTNGLMKDVLGLIEAPVLNSANEFSIAALIYAIVSQNPSSTNQLTQLEYTFAYGVTPYPQKGNAALLTTYDNFGVNYIQTGGEGGISNTIIENGMTMDKNPWEYWYAGDWMALNMDQSLANYIINWSQNPLNPLKYNQTGIDRLQGVAAAVAQRAVTFGISLFPPIQTKLTGPQLAAALDADAYQGFTVINAVPFIPYSIASPSDYATRTYSGLSCSFVPQYGFSRINFNLIVSNFVG